MGFIDKFLSKKNRTPNNSAENQILEVPENWNFYMCHIDEQPASYFLNLALADVAPPTRKINLSMGRNTNEPLQRRRVIFQ